jgi:hypothetical protein
MYWLIVAIQLPRWLDRKTENLKPMCVLADEVLPAAVPCSMCGEGPAALPHVNCANIDCNELFIACAACKTK